MATSGQRVAAAVPRMQKRGGSQSRAGGRLFVVRSDGHRDRRETPPFDRVCAGAMRTLWRLEVVCRGPELGPYLRGRRGPAAWPPVRRDPRLFCAGAPAAGARHGRPRSGRLHAPCSRLGLLGAVSDSLLGLHRDAGPAQQGLYLAHQGHARARASEFDVLDPRADGLRWLDYYHDDQSATAPTVSAAPTAARRASSVPLNPTTVLGSWVAVETFIRRARQQAKAAR